MTDEREARHRPNSNRRVIHAHCTSHGGPIGFTNLVVRKVDGTIELDSHAVGCVILIDESGATELRDALIGWLG